MSATIAPGTRREPVPRLILLSLRMRWLAAQGLRRVVIGAAIAGSHVQALSTRVAHRWAETREPEPPNACPLPHCGGEMVPLDMESVTVLEVERLHWLRCQRCNMGQAGELRR